MVLLSSKINVTEVVYFMLMCAHVYVGNEWVMSSIHLTS